MAKSLKKIKEPDKATYIAAFRKKFAVSYSRLSLYEQCPAKFYYKNIAKLAEGPREALTRGIKAHKGGEDYLKGATKDLPTMYEGFKKEMVRLKKLGAESEKDWAFTRLWKPTGWFDKDCWMRVKTDASLLAGKLLTIVDYKTGKRYDDKHEDCAQLYATSSLSIYETVEKVRVEYYYLDLKKDNKSVYEFDRAPLLAARKTWEQRAQRIERDEKFLPRLNKYCGWCDYRAELGGPCPF